MRPSISCVIPTFNRADIVLRAAQSALDQEPPPKEVIVVDDGSTDGTKEALAQHQASITYILQENRGGAAARNTGARATTSEWIAFLDSDDYWVPGHLAAVTEAIEATQGSADIYFCNLKRTAREEGRLQWTQASFEIEGKWCRVEDGTDWVIRPRIPMMLQGSVFHRERFLAKGGLWEVLRRRHDTHCFLSHGVGHPLCAVNHIGTLMTCDDDTGARLTAEMSPKSQAYWEYSTMLWDDLLQRLPDLNRPGTQLLRHRLLVSYLNLARISLRARRPLRMIRHLASAGLVSPTLFAKSLLGRRPSEFEILNVTADGSC